MLPGVCTAEPKQFPQSGQCLVCILGPWPLDLRASGEVGVSALEDSTAWLATALAPLCPLLPEPASNVATGESDRL